LQLKCNPLPNVARAEERNLLYIVGTMNANVGDVVMVVFIKEIEKTMQT
jgi:hypothetical protein